MKIKAEIDGKELEFEELFYWGGLGKPVGATHYFTGGGGINAIGDERNMEGRLTLRLIRPRHTHGGVEFEETGENRKPEKDEFYLGTTLDGKGVCTQHGPGSNHGATYPILRHVCGE